MKLGKDYFECVEQFVYLGVAFDVKASSRSMVQRVITKGRKAMYWLLRWV